MVAVCKSHQHNCQCQFHALPAARIVYARSEKAEFVFFKRRNLLKKFSPLEKTKKSQSRMLKFFFQKEFSAICTKFLASFSQLRKVA
jgi:hypothetical protein